MKDFRSRECKYVLKISLYASYHENNLSKISHGLKIHDIILITPVRDDDLRAHSTCKYMQQVLLMDMVIFDSIHIYI